MSKKAISILKNQIQDKHTTTPLKHPTNSLLKGSKYVFLA